MLPENYYLFIIIKAFNKILTLRVKIILDIFTLKGYFINYGFRNLIKLTIEVLTWKKKSHLKTKYRPRLLGWKMTL